MNKFIFTAARHWKLLGLFNLLLLAVTCSIMVQAKKTWTAEAKLILPKPTSDLNANLGTLGNISSGQGAVFSQQLNSLKILASIITSKDSLRQVWQQDEEKDLYPRLESYQKLFSVSPQNESTIIEIAIEGSSPELAQQRTEALLDTFQKRLQNLRAEEASQRAVFLSTELAIAEENLELAETELNNYKGSVNIIDNDLQAQEILSAVKTLSTEKSQAMARSKASQEKVKELSARLQMTPEAGIESLRLGENAEYLAVKQSISQVEARLARARSQFFEDSPQVQNLREERDKLASQLSNFGVAIDAPQNASSSNSSGLVQEMILADSAAKESQQQVEQLKVEIDELNQELRTLPGKQKKLVELKRRYNTAEGVHNGLVAQVQESKLNGLSSYPNVQLLDAPDVDSKPTKPKKSLVALGFLLTSAFGSAAIILFLDQSDSLLDNKDIEDVELTVLATIPELEDPQQDIRFNERVVIEFQKLALGVSMMELERNRLMVSSTTAGEGKTTVVLGLAHALADLGFQVLMVDGDYRQAGLSRALGFSPQQESPLTTIKPTTIAEKIDLLPIISPPRNIAEFVARGSFANELDIIQQQGYDYVLIDTPPISLTSEAAMMAKIIDHLLYVVRPGITEKSEFFQSLEQVDVSQDKVLGMVVNGVTSKKTYLSYQKKAYLPESIES
ncbi:MAG: AAA family ATPase [Cyanobacteria bacterium J06621_12]